jgi:hypothetical protein
MRPVQKFGVSAAIAAALVFFGVAGHAYQSWRHAQDATPLSGYILIVLFLMLGLFSSRKKLAMLPAGRAAYWTAAHSVGGLMAIGLYFVHTSGTVWPGGSAERLLAALFYLVSLSGLIGYALQRLLPSRLTQAGVEVIYERVPAELADIRQRVEALVTDATEQHGSDTLARHYVESLSWFFRRPRFFFDHLGGGRRGLAWVARETEAVSRYLDDSEKACLDEIAELAEIKDRVDFHWSLQTVLRYWLFVHIPLAAAAIVLALWHVILVHVYVI